MYSAQFSNHLLSTPPPPLAIDPRYPLTLHSEFIMLINLDKNRSREDSKSVYPPNSDPPPPTTAHLALLPFLPLSQHCPLLLVSTSLHPPSFHLRGPHPPHPRHFPSRPSLPFPHPNFPLCLPSSLNSVHQNTNNINQLALTKYYCQPLRKKSGKGN